MIITVKNLQQQTFTVEFEAEKTVLELKEKIFIERGPEYVVEKQKLIYAGVILDDDRTIASYNVDEKKFVVVMLKRDLGGAPPKPDESGAAAAIRSEQSAASSSGNSAAGDSESTKEVGTATADKGTATKSTEDKASGTASGPSGSDEDTKSVGSGGSDSSGGGAVLGPVGSNTSILSSGSGTSLMSGSSIGSGSSETSHSTYSSGDLAGVFSNTSLQSRAESNLLMGDEYNRSVESMIEMGYCREMVERAMAASFNNPERAVEYLISGIPENEDGFNATSAAAGESVLLRGAGVGEGGDGAGDAGAQGDGARTVGGGGGDGGDGDGPAIRIESGGGEGVMPQRSDGGFGDGQPARTVEGANVAAATAAGDAAATSGGDPFEFLRNQPQFLQMRSLVYQNPDLLHAVLQQIGQTNPALLQLISENQDAFLSMLNQPMEGQTGTNPQYPRRMTPGRRAQLAAAARAAAGGDGLHVRSLDTAPGAGGDGPPARQRPGESGDAGADTIPHDMLPPRPDRAAERRAAAADAFMRERAAAAAAVAALTAAASAAVERDAGGGEGGAVSSAAPPVEAATPTIGIPAPGGGGRLSAGSVGTPAAGVGDGGSVSTGGDVRTHAGPGGMNTIRLTTQDLDAIGRLTALGFPETLVLQAYFACDRDEQLAANFLISSNFDD